MTRPVSIALVAILLAALAVVAVNAATPVAVAHHPTGCWTGDTATVYPDVVRGVQWRLIAPNVTDWTDDANPLTAVRTDSGGIVNAEWSNGQKGARTLPDCPPPSTTTTTTTTTVPVQTTTTTTTTTTTMPTSSTTAPTTSTTSTVPNATTTTAPPTTVPPGDTPDTYVPTPRPDEKGTP